MLWKEELKVDIKTFSQNHIDAWVNGGEVGWWHFTGFYGHSDMAKRHESWAKLRHLKDRLDYHGWLLVILMRLWVSQRRKVEVFVQVNRWLTLYLLLIIVDCVIWASLDLNSLGYIKQLVGFKYEKDWIGLWLHWSGDLFIQQLSFTIYPLRFWIILLYHFICFNNGRKGDTKKFLGLSQCG